jgi:hypothetical protein
MFIGYPHIERLTSDEVDGLLIGACYVFPKIDGTNASVWLEDGEIRAGSRTRELSTEQDNAGFFDAIRQDERIKALLTEYPTWRIYGEWLVPHTLRTYRQDAWRKFYVFDILGNDRFVTYDEYAPVLDRYGIDYIPLLVRVENPTEEWLVKKLESNTFLIQDGAGVGEGLVVKRYDFVNRYGRTTWAKIVRNEFKEANGKVFGAGTVEMKGGIEAELAQEFVTLGRIDKILEKMREDAPFTSKRIPELFNRVWNDVITEEMWGIVKKHKMPTIDFKRFYQFVIAQIKSIKPELF